MTLATRALMLVIVWVASCSGAPAEPAEGEGEPNAEGEGEGDVTGEDEGDPEWQDLYSQDDVEQFAAASHVIHYNRVTLYEGDISDLTPLRGVVFETDEIIIVGTLLTTTDGMDSARIGDSVRIVGAENLLVVEGFEASPSVAVGLAGLPSLQRVDLPTNTGPNSHWPNGNLCTIILPMMPGTPEYCERVRTEVPMCGTPEDPQPAVLVTGCPP